MESRSLFGSAVAPLRLVFLMWLVFFLDISYGWNIHNYGIVPRTWWGLVGILTAPLIHYDIVHLISNTVPLLVLGTMLYFFYPQCGSTVFFRGYFWTDILVWLFARPAVHLGASGLIYCLASFLVFFGILRRDFLSLAIAALVVVLYGGIFYGILPSDPHISWEAHFAGALVGIFSAFTLTRRSPY